MPGSTRYVSFDTIRATYRTAPNKCHVSHVVGDIESWEQKMAQTLEDMAEVRATAEQDESGARNSTIDRTTVGTRREVRR